MAWHCEFCGAQEGQRCATDICAKAANVRELLRTELADARYAKEIAEQQIDEVTALLRRAEDALGPDRTPQDRKDALMVLGEFLTLHKTHDL